MTQIKDLQNKKYCLVQVDHEVLDIQRDYCNKQDNFFPYLIVELDKSKADIKRIWGSDSCNLDASAYLIYTTQFNKRIEN